MKNKNIVILVLIVLLTVSVAVHFFVPYYQGMIQNVSRQAALQAAASTLVAIQQRVTSAGEVVIETQQGKMTLVAKPEKKGKKRK